MIREPAAVLAVAAALSGAAAPALAQQYRCVDAAGRVSYSDKGGPGCQQRSAPPSAPSKAQSPSKASARGTPPPPPPETQEQIAGRCTATRQEYEWLKGPRGEGVAGRDARLAQMQKALASCP